LGDFGKRITLDHGGVAVRMECVSTVDTFFMMVPGAADSWSGGSAQVI